MIPSLSLIARGYKGANADFPYESTADQFFSPEQFEAYRDVGVCIARQMLAETDLAALFADGRPPLDRLRRNDFFVVEERPDPDPPRPSAYRHRRAGRRPARGWAGGARRASPGPGIRARRRHARP